MSLAQYTGEARVNQQRLEDEKAARLKAERGLADSRQSVSEMRSLLAGLQSEVDTSAIKLQQQTEVPLLSNRSCRYDMSNV